ncbi:MAG: MFS transporter, partial [Chloroflexota bacterium]
MAGWLIDKFGPKKVVTGGLLILAAGMFPLANADSLAEFYLYFGILTSIGVAATGPVIATSVVSRWFTQKRALAMSIATSGAAFGQLMIVPIAAEILARSDWHTAYYVLGAALLVLTLPLALFVLRDGPKGTVSASKSPDAVGWRLPEALQGPLFWLLAIGFLVCGWTMAFPNVHFIAHADDMGMSHTISGLTVSVTAVFSIAGSILLGMAADRHRRSSVLALVYA